MDFYQRLPSKITVRAFGYEPDPDGTSTNIELKLLDPELYDPVVVLVVKKIDYFKWSNKRKDYEHLKGETDTYDVELIQCPDCDNQTHDIDTCKYCKNVFDQLYLSDLKYGNQSLYQNFKNYLAYHLLSVEALKLYSAKIENEEKESVLRRMKKYDDAKLAEEKRAREERIRRENQAKLELEKRARDEAESRKLQEAKAKADFDEWYASILGKPLNRDTTKPQAPKYDMDEMVASIMAKYGGKSTKL